MRDNTEIFSEPRGQLTQREESGESRPVAHVQQRQRGDATLLLPAVEDTHHEQPSVYHKLKAYRYDERAESVRGLS